MADYASSVGWRFPLAFQAFIAILMSVLLCFMPECMSLLIGVNYSSPHE
jgi:Sugar (and other) transporter